MKKLMLVVVFMMLMVSVSFVQAQDKGTPDEAKALVKKAVAFTKEVGKDKALVEFNNPKGKFVYKDLYVFVTDISGVSLAHPMTPALVGKNLTDLKDADGKYFVRERAEIVKAKGSGTVDYRWSNPKTKKVEKKQTYFESADGIIFSCGYYK